MLSFEYLLSPRYAPEAHSTKICTVANPPPSYTLRQDQVSGLATSAHPFWSVSFRWWVWSVKRKESVKCGVYKKDCAAQKETSALWSVKCKEWSAELPPTNMATPKETHRIKTKQGGHQNKNFVRDFKHCGHVIKHCGMSESVTWATLKKATCCEKFETFIVSTFPHRHGHRDTDTRRPRQHVGEKN